MLDFIDSVDYMPKLHDVGRCLAAFILALPVGYQREKKERNAGLRTYPLVAVTCCVFMLIGREAIGDQDGAARLISGVMTGLGFLGGGAILKTGETIRGTATAITLWGTGAVGVCCAYDRFDLGILLTVIMLFGLWFLRPIKEKVDSAGGSNELKD